MISICNSTKIISKKSEVLFQFCKDNSKFIVFARQHTGGIRKEVLNDIIELELLRNEERKVVQLESVKNMTSNELNFLGINNRSQIINKIRNQGDENRRVIESSTHDYKDKEDTLVTDLEPYGLCKRTFSFGSFFTWPGIWDMCYFDIDYVDCNPIKLHFFNGPTYIGDYEFEDFGFADKNGTIWAKVCPHEEYFQFNLSERQFARFKHLNIPYNIIFPKK